MCATHNVSQSTQMIMTEEFKRGQCTGSAILWGADRLTVDAGSEIVEKVIMGTAQWSELFVKHDFFHKYRYYLQVIASTGEPDLHIKWQVCWGYLSF